MNVQQLEYIIALEKCRHFQKAADDCYITQATLSTMIKKLEDELGIAIFDRSKQPVRPTEAGLLVLEQAEKILKEVAVMKNISADMKGEIKGDLHIGIITTLSPFLLPLFLNEFLSRYPLVKVFIKEITTQEILNQLQNGKLDIGIVATPLEVDNMVIQHLFYERFLVYVSKNEKKLKKKFILPEEIDVNRLLLLEEGHCLRSQVMNLCELRKKNTGLNNLEFEAGSIDSLLRMVDVNNGITILPELAAIGFSRNRLNQVHEFKAPVPVREISLITGKHFVKRKLKDALASSVISSVQKWLPEKPGKTQVIAID